MPAPQDLPKTMTVAGRAALLRAIDKGDPLELRDFATRLLASHDAWETIAKQALSQCERATAQAEVCSEQARRAIASAEKLVALVGGAL